MARIDKIIEKVRTGLKNLSKNEAITLLEHLGFTFVRNTRHCEFYSFEDRIISLNRHKKTIHSKAIKEIRLILEDLFEEE